MDLKNICHQVIEVAIEAGRFIADNSGKIKQNDVEIKGLHDFVTFVDKSSEKMIVEALEKILPNAGFLVEENTRSDNNSELKWIVDPLDGTTNFIHGISPYAVSIALANSEEILVGVVYEITQKEIFSAWKGGGAFLNNKPIEVSSKSKMEESFVATGFPYYDYSRMDGYLASMKEAMKKSVGIRRLGSAATDLVYVACGRFEIFYEYSLSPWDVAAGALIVEEAGGIVSDFSGGNNYLLGKEIVSCNNLVYSEFMQLIKKYL